MNTKKTTFSAVVELPDDYGCSEVTVDVEFDKDEEHLTYDEVVDTVYDTVDKVFSCRSYEDDEEEYEFEREDYPTIVSLVINADDGESYPVISESMDDNELKKDKAFSKYLVLPEARYSLTPECKLWMELKKEGILDEDAPFEFEKFHKMLEKKVI